MEILAVDVGTMHLKAGVAGPDGRLRRLTVRELPMKRDGTGQAEHHPELLWARLVDAIREATAAEPRRVRWMVLSAYQLSLLPVDASGRPLMGILTLQDTRPRETFPNLLERMDAQRAYERTGARPSSSTPWRRWSGCGPPDRRSSTGRAGFWMPSPFSFCGWSGDR